jgi:WD40 repeat protein
VQALIVVGCTDGSLAVLLFSEGKFSVVSRSVTHPAAVTAVAFDSTGQRVISVGGGFLAVSGLTPVLPLLAHATTPASVDSFACGDELGVNNTLVVLVTRNPGKASHMLAYSIPNQLQSAHKSESLALLPAVLNKREFKMAADVCTAAVAKGALVALASTHRSLLQTGVFSSQSVAHPKTFEAHLLRGNGSVFVTGPDAVVCSGGADGRVCIFDADNLASHTSTTIHDGVVCAVSAFFDGSKYVFL